ncbi:orotidine-5'-phosphate decarboxylase [Salinarimonas ramus]|uniref:Orotidine 5'-phosphate decarboxylase n=1 Tax=Salinarimonas ramus TaxID=690164 RepID=A0A917QGI9_9HYPH|nr:orotidine-5'-phosphate decarboxylase [Salinarimonas ramus]GGK47940.1 orotidine 5'-phosphate decarboxylase [Salinarimonas ramus]
MTRTAIPLEERLVVGLDVPTVEEARALVSRIGDAGRFYKIGYRLGFSGGLDFARELVDAGKKVFLDFKLHDIANTVEEGVAAVAAMGVDLLTVHAYPQTMAAAVAGRGESGLKILAVTVLTSWDDADLAQAGFTDDVASLVARRAQQAREAHVDGIVASAAEAARIRGIVGEEMLIVTPGIRPAGAEAGDQKRVVTPADALRAGADLLVVARPIIRAEDPRAAAQAILEEMATAA